MCAQIWKHDTAVSCIVINDEANFISLDASVGISVSFWGNEHPREHLEHERDSPKVNAWCALTHERGIDPFSFDEYIITSNSFLEKLKIMHFCSSPSSTTMLFFNWTVRLFFLLTLSLTLWT
jgi:hypothetical protein